MTSAPKPLHALTHFRLVLQPEPPTVFSTRMTRMSAEKMAVFDAETWRFHLLLLSEKPESQTLVLVFQPQLLRLTLSLFASELEDIGALHWDFQW